jgi:hypothetical protein
MFNLKDYKIEFTGYPLGDGRSVQKDYEASLDRGRLSEWGVPGGSSEVAMICWAGAGADRMPLIVWGTDGDERGVMWRNHTLATQWLGALYDAGEAINHMFAEEQMRENRATQHALMMEARKG